MRKLADIGGMLGLAASLVCLFVEVAGRHAPRRAEARGYEPLDRLLLQHDINRRYTATWRGRAWALRERLHGRCGIAA